MTPVKIATAIMMVCAVITAFQGNQAAGIIIAIYAATIRISHAIEGEKNVHD